MSLRVALTNQLGFPGRSVEYGHRGSLSLKKTEQGGQEPAGRNELGSSKLRGRLWRRRKLLHAQNPPEAQKSPSAWPASPQKEAFHLQLESNFGGEEMTCMYTCVAHLELDLCLAVFDVISSGNPANPRFSVLLWHSLLGSGNFDLSLQWE